MRHVFTSLWQAVQCSLKALAYADKGELLPMLTKQQILDNEGPLAVTQSPGIASVAAPRKRIVVAFDGQVDQGTLRYAADAALHHEVQLDILTNVNTSKVCIEVQRELGNLREDWKVVQLAGDMLAAIASYTLRHSAVLFVIIREHDRLTEQIVSARAAGCVVKTPLLVYSGNNPRAA